VIFFDKLFHIFQEPKKVSMVATKKKINIHFLPKDTMLEKGFLHLTNTKSTCHLSKWHHLKLTH